MVGSTNALPAGAQYDMAVAKKVQNHTEEQGKQALQLIQSAGGGTPAHVGNNLNVSA